MSNYRYAVIYVWLEQGIPNIEIWSADHTLQEAEDKRLSYLNEDSGIDPQNMQVLQYVV